RGTQVVRVGRNDDVLELGSADQRLQVGEDLLAADRRCRASVLHEILKLSAPAHGIDRDDDRIGAENGIEADDELRAVLHVDQHPVAPLHPQVLQIAGQSLNLVLQLTEGDRRIVVDDGVLVGKAQRRDFEIHVNTGLRQIEMVSSMHWPDLVMTRKHLNLSPVMHCLSGAAAANPRKMLRRSRPRNAAPWYPLLLLRREPARAMSQRLAHNVACWRCWVKNSKT